MPTLTLLLASSDPNVRMDAAVAGRYWRARRSRCSRARRRGATGAIEAVIAERMIANIERR